MEQYDYEYFSAWWNFKDFYNNFALNFWQDTLGFGSRLPIGFNFLFHPAIILSSGFSYKEFLYLNTSLYVALGIFGFYKFLNYLGCSNKSILLGIAYYLLCSPLLHYSLKDDWPTVLGVYCTLPYLLYRIDKVCSNPDKTKNYIKLGCYAGLIILWAHLSQFIQYAIPTICFFCLRINKKIGVKQKILIPVSCFIILLISLPNLWVLFEAIRDFWGVNSAKISGVSLSPIQWLLQNLWPLNDIKILKAVPCLSSEIENWRGAFCGVFIYFVLYSILKNTFFLKSKISNSNEKALGISFLISFAFSCIPSHVFRNIFSAGWLFRDPAILFAVFYFIIKANSQNEKQKKLYFLILATSIIQVTTYRIPEIERIFKESYQVKIMQNIKQSQNFWEFLNSYVPQNSMVYQTERVAETLIRRGKMKYDGVYASTDFLKNGYQNPVRRYFKLINYDKFDENAYKFYGKIDSKTNIINNKDNANFFSINFLLASDKEDQQILKQNYEFICSYKLKFAEEAINLFKNSSASPQVILLQENEFEKIKDFEKKNIGKKILEIDWSEIQKINYSKVLKSNFKNDTRYIKIVENENTQFLILKKKFDTAWDGIITESSGANYKATVFPIFQDFTAVLLPKKSVEVILKYRPLKFTVCWLVSFLTLIFCVFYISYKNKNTV